MHHPDAMRDSSQTAKGERIKAKSRIGGKLNNFGINRTRAFIGAVLAMAAASLLTGCTGTGSGQGETSTAAPTTTASASATPTGPTATVTAVIPDAHASPMPSEQPELLDPALAVEKADADRLTIERFLATAWDTMEPMRLEDVSIGDCLFFDYDYQNGTTALFTVDCSTPHEGEVMAIYQHPEYDEYPGQGNLNRIVGPVLADTADTMRQAGQMPTSAHRDLVPTEGDWESGQRTSISLLSGNSSLELLERSYFNPDRIKVYEVPDLGSVKSETPAGGA